MISNNLLNNMTSEEMNAYLNGCLDTLEFETIVSKSLKDYDDKVLYSGLTHKYDLNKDTETKELEYKKKIGYTLKGEVKKILKKRGKTFLMISSAGSGKTYVMLQVSAELVKENKENNVVYILSVPNTSQSNQNQISEDLEQFEFISEVGKDSKLKIEGNEKSITEKLKEGNRKFSCVYDKTLEIVEEAKKMGLEVVLIVDESHKLVYDTYRQTSLDGMDKAIKMADMNVMMTATADACKLYYKYDMIYDLINKEQQNNIEEFKLIFSNNWNLTLRRELRRLKAKGKVALVKIACSIKEMKSIKEALEKQGYIVEILSSENKDGYIFKTIEQYGLIGADVDVVITTSVVEAGISLKDKDVVPVEIIRGSNDFNMDNTIQFFARPREEVSEGIMIVKNYSDDIGKELLEYEEEIKKSKKVKLKRPVRKIVDCINEVRNQATRYYGSFKGDMKKKLETEYLETVREYMVEELRTDRSKSIEFDTEKMELYVNTKSVIKEAFRRRDSHMIRTTPLSLLTAFEGSIFYNKLTTDIDLGGNVNEEDLENLKEQREKKKEQDAIDGARENEYREWFTDKNFLKALPALVDGSLNRANIKNYNLNMSLRDLIEFRASSLYNVMQICLRHFTIAQTGKIISSKYKESGKYITKSHIKDICKRAHIVEKIKNGYFEDLETEYNIICDIVQTYKTKNKTQAPKQINLTDDMIIILMAELHRNGCAGYRNKAMLEKLAELKETHKGKINWKTFYNENIIKELKTAISNSSGDIKTTSKNKIINEVGKIYNLGTQVKSGKEYLVINNPYKTFKLDTTLEAIISSK